jgi:hypothetical protein
MKAAHNARGHTRMRAFTAAPRASASCRLSNRSRLHVSLHDNRAGRGAHASRHITALRVLQRDAASPKSEAEQFSAEIMEQLAREEEAKEVSDEALLQAGLDQAVAEVRVFVLCARAARGERRRQAARSSDPGRRPQTLNTHLSSPPSTPSSTSAFAPSLPALP